MKRGSTLFLKCVIFLIGLIVAVALIRLPQLEGRAADLDLFSIYADPFILYIYMAFVPFFIALFQAVKLLGLIEKNTIFSQLAINTVKNIKLCIIIFIGFIVAADVYIAMMARFVTGDDSAGFIALGAIVIFASSVIATVAAVAQKLLESAVNIKSENDLTV